MWLGRLFSVLLSGLPLSSPSTSASSKLGSIKLKGGPDPASLPLSPSKETPMKPAAMVEQRQAGCKIAGSRLGPDIAASAVV